MPDLIFCEPGSDGTHDLTPWTGSSGSVSSSTEQAHSGPRSIKCDSTGSALAAYVTRTTWLWSGATGRVSAWFYLSHLPQADTILIRVPDTSGNNTWQVRINGSAQLVLRNNAGSSIDTGSAVLTTGQWYRLCLAWSFTSYTATEARLYLDGGEEAGLSNATLLSFVTAPRRVELGLIGTPGGSKVCYLDDVYCDNGSHTDGDPGDIRVTAKLPASDSQANWDTDVGAATSAGTRYVNCAERPLSTTNGRSQNAAASQADETYTIQAASVGDVDLTGATLCGHLAWIYWKFGAGTQGTAQIWDDGARTNLTGVTSNTFAYKANASTSYPSNADAIGVRSGGNDADTFLYECGIFIAYIEGAPASDRPPALLRGQAPFPHHLTNF